MTGPLDGLRVIDAGTMIAAGYCGALLADYGADVIKIEKPGGGDSLRDWPPHRDGESLWWKVTARNKRLVTLDLRAPEGREIMLALAAEADAVIENYRPGTFAKWGLGYDHFAAAQPYIVLLHISGYGQAGPYAQRPGYGTVAEAMSGVPSFTGPPDRPQLSAFPMADTLAGTFGALALLAALHEPRGREIDLALYEPMFRLAETQIAAYDQTGTVKRRRGNRLDEDSPRNAYRTLDGDWIAISASGDRPFARLAAAIGQSGLARDERFQTLEARCRNDIALDDIIGAWISERDSAEVLAAFRQHDVIAGRVYDASDIVSDPHYRARGNIVSVPDGRGGVLRMPGVTPLGMGELRWCGGAQGSHNQEVFGGLLGMSDQELRALRERDVI